MAIKKIHSWLTALAALIVVAGLAWFFYNAVMSPASSLGVNANLPTETITIGTSTLQVEVASTDAQRKQGLSGRTSLAQGHGMFFVFQQDGNLGFWMKDMNFSIDMIFISATQTPNIGSVASVAANASPASYNAQDPQSSQVFYPPLPVRYVLEVPAGYAAAHGIVPGVKVVLQ